MCDSLLQRRTSILSDVLTPFPLVAGGISCKQKHCSCFVVICNTDRWATASSQRAMKMTPAGWRQSKNRRKNPFSSQAIPARIPFQSHKEEHSGVLLVGMRQAESVFVQCGGLSKLQCECHSSMLVMLFTRKPMRKVHGCYRDTTTTRAVCNDNNLIPLWLGGVQQILPKADMLATRLKAEPRNNFDEIAPASAQPPTCQLQIIYL